MDDRMKDTKLDTDTELTITTKAGTGRASHDHIVYLNSKNGNGTTSYDKDHFHVFIWQDGSQMTIDNDPNSPTYGQMIGAVMQRGWICQPAGKDNHTHGIGEYQLKEDSFNESEAEKVSEVIRAFKSAKEYEHESIKNGQKAYGYYWGDEQWTPQHEKKLDSEKRAHVSFNLTQKNVDELSGHQRQSRTDIRFYPTENGDAVIADILTIVSKNILNGCNFAMEESNIFRDETVAGKGVVNMDINFDKNIQGDIVVEQFPWDECFFGPHNKQDASDCEYLVKTRWFSLDKLRELYPDKQFVITPTSRDDDSAGNTVPQPTVDPYGPAGETGKTDPDLVNYMKKEYRLLERWQKIYRTVYVLVNSEDNFYFDSYGWSENDIRRTKTIPGFYNIKTVRTKIRITKTAGSTLLEDEYPADIALDDFFIFPVYAKRYKEKYKGIIFDAIDPQDTINKYVSQSIDIANRMLSSIWFYDTQTFPTQKDKNKFQLTSAVSGSMHEVQDVTRIPQRSEPPQFPQALIGLITLAFEKLAEIMNIHPEPIGSNDSGVAMMQKQRIKLTGNDFLFDNLSFAKKQLGIRLVALIQKYFTPDRILRIVANQAAKQPANQPLKLAGQPLTQYNPQDLYRLLNDADLMKYDLEPGETNWTPTTRLANLQVMMDLLKSGAPVPPELILEFMDALPTDLKEKILTGIQQMKMAQAQSQQSKERMEMGKTMIAAQSKQQQQGRPPVPRGQGRQMPPPGPMMPTGM